MRKSYPRGSFIKLRQSGFLTIVAVLLILVIGFLGVAVTYMIFGSSVSTINYLQSSQAFYLAESGLEQAVHSLLTSTISNRTACSGLSLGNSLGAGAYQTTATGPFYVSSPTALSGTLNATTTTIPVISTAAYQNSGRIMIDGELINYSSVNASNFLGVTRGVDGSTAAIHSSGALIGQYQCNLSAQGGVPSLNPSSTNLGGKRILTEAVQLQEGWAVGNTLAGTNWNIAHWNTPTEKQWTQQVPAIASAQQLNAVSIVSNVDAWIVGNKAVLLHYTGSAWSNINGGVGGAENLLSVSAISSTEAWASSVGGDVWKWSGGSTWVKAYNGSNQLNSISMVDSTGNGSADSGWAVGNKKTAVRYNGSSWVSANTGINVDLNGVSSLSATDVWAAGNSGKTFQWNGSSWASIANPTSATLNAISMIRSGALDLGWAVGNSSTALYYNGSSWISSNTGLAGGLTLNGVVTVSSNEAWLVDSNGHIYEWNGSTWTLIFTSTAALNGIDLVHPRNEPFSAWAENFA